MSPPRDTIERALRRSLYNDTTVIPKLQLKTHRGLRESLDLLGKTGGLKVTHLLSPTHLMETPE